MSSKITAFKSDDLTLIHGRFTVSNKEGDRTFTIIPEYLCQDKALRFLALYEQEISKKQFCKQFVAKQPWSAYLIQEGDCVVGRWIVTYMRTAVECDGSAILQIGLNAVTGSKSDVATGIWKWTVERLLPELHAKGFQIPVFEKGEIVKYVPIPEGCIRIRMSKTDSVRQVFSRFHLIEENMDCRHGVKYDMYEMQIADLLSSWTKNMWRSNNGSSFGIRRRQSSTFRTFFV